MGVGRRPAYETRRSIDFGDDPASWGRCEYALRLFERGLTWAQVGLCCGHVTATKARQWGEQARRRRARIARAPYPGVAPSADEVMRAYKPSP